ncbi:hypothetical protein K470DRAFT_215263 [Piedraia hortae CBS 480.64]|uniref:Uncharacterized protein n=1 Tax=Piedraia hortae CBS 480.64 TaxID=1314780 RepID=A0A6A7C2C6_9PEZI|nr:hypothetical protein K470DRAFT_215263 [Piedraia hortae CBS 480.64]
MDGRAKQPSSVHSSPTRAGNLFADYNPHSPSKTLPFGSALNTSPSLPEFTAVKLQSNSDVQGLVKRFEHLDVRDRDAETRKRHEAELRRARIAREEAESDARKLKEEAEQLRAELGESRERERRVAERLETMMEEHASEKAQLASQVGVYEKEVRKYRKEALKSSSAVIKLQEDIKSMRSKLQIANSGLDVEKEKVQRREEDTFSAQYKLAALQEEVEKLRAYVKIADEEKEALKKNLREEEVARIAAEGKIALPEEEDVDMQRLSDKENGGTVSKKTTTEIKTLKDDLLKEQMLREHLEEMVEFLTLECRFQCCSCRGSQRTTEKAAGETAINNTHEAEPDPQTPPESPRHRFVRTTTTTTTIPMHFTPVTKPTAVDFTPSAVEDAENIAPAGSFDREAALEAIKYRRDRARSFATGHLTPRKQMLVGVKERRDVSAPALGEKRGSALNRTPGRGTLG